MVLAPGYWVLGTGCWVLALALAIVMAMAMAMGRAARRGQRMHALGAVEMGWVVDSRDGCAVPVVDNACEVEMTMSNTPSGNPSTQNSVSRVAQRRPRHQLAARGRSLLSPRSHAQPVVQIASVGFAAAPATPRHATPRH